MTAQTCGRCGRPATTRLPIADGDGWVCVAHAIEFWTGVVQTGAALAELDRALTNATRSAVDDPVVFLPAWVGPAAVPTRLAHRRSRLTASRAVSIREQFAAGATKSERVA